MDRKRAEDALGYVVKLFPRWKTTAELNSLWVETLMRHDETTATIVLKAHRLERKGNDPSLGDISRQLDAASRQARARTSTEPPAQANPICPDFRTFAEVAVWRLANQRNDPAEVAVLEQVAAGVPADEIQGIGECRRAVLRGEGARGVLKALGEFKGSGIARTQKQRDAEQEQARQNVIAKLNAMQKAGDV